MQEALLTLSTSGYPCLTLSEENSVCWSSQPSRAGGGLSSINHDFSAPKKGRQERRVDRVGMSQDVNNAEPTKLIQDNRHPVPFGHNLMKKKLIRDLELESLIRYKSSSAEHESGGSRLRCGATNH